MGTVRHMVQLLGSGVPQALPGRPGETRMKRTWTIIGVSDVTASFTWYQSLLGLPENAPAHDHFGQIIDSDETVLLCLHAWGAP